MATKKATKKGQSNTAIALEVGAGVLAAAAAAGAGYYFYGDKKAKKHRQAASKWAKDMKAKVLKEAKALKKLDQKAIGVIVANTASAYETVRGVDKQDVKRAAAELKKNWKEIEREVSAVSKKAKPAVKKAVKKTVATAKKAVKAAKKSVKKATKKGKI